MMEGLEDAYEPCNITYGRIIGKYKDKPIYDLIYINGRPFEYSGITNEPPKYTGDAVIAPGLLYRQSTLHKE
jgi:hypothetical protein